LNVWNGSRNAHAIACAREKHNKNKNTKLAFDVGSPDLVASLFVL